MGGELTRAAKDFDAHLHLNLRRFRAAMPTPRSSAMAQQTLPQSDWAPGKPRPACAPLFLETVRPVLHRHPNVH